MIDKVWRNGRKDLFQKCNKQKGNLVLSKDQHESYFIKVNRFAKKNSDLENHVVEVELTQTQAYRLAASILHQ